MTLFDMTRVRDGSPITEESLVRIPATSFREEGVREREHLQAVLRDNIDVIDDSLLVVSEEFGDFEGAQRRIDLLCLDRDGRLVVVELKRTSDGGHMELQAIRYAAMVSTMTFAQVVRALSAYRRDRGMSESSIEAGRADLLAWVDLDEDEGADPEISRDVRIILASEDFSQEITTTVLWLNEFHGFDVRCLRLAPYRHDDRLLLDVQQVIPLPEASEYVIKVREKEKAAQQAKSAFAPDRALFVVRSPAGETEPLAKRWAILRLVEAMADAGVAVGDIVARLPAGKMMHLTGTYEDSENLWRAAQDQHARADANWRRWHLSDPIVIAGDTWVLNNNWGHQFRPTCEQLLEIAPGGFEVVEQED